MELRKAVEEALRRRTVDGRLSCGRGLNLKILVDSTGRHANQGLKAELFMQPRGLKAPGAAVEAGTRRVAERGEWPGGVRLDGYRLSLSLDVRGRVLRAPELDPARRPIIQEIFRLGGQG
jgi:hypothetical protein